MIKNITNHRVTSSAVPITQGHYKTSYGVNKRIVTTKGWYLQVEWTNGNRSWVPLKELKESDPIKVAEYAKACNIHTDPAFAWWVNHTLKKHDRIIKAVKPRMKRTNMKFGIQVPKDISEAEDLDTANGNTLWHDAIEKEKKNVIIAFKLLQDDD